MKAVAAAWREGRLKMEQEEVRRAFRRTCFRLYSLFWWREQEADGRRMVTLV